MRHSVGSSADFKARRDFFGHQPAQGQTGRTLKTFISSCCRRKTAWGAWSLPVLKIRATARNPAKRPGSGPIGDWKSKRTVRNSVFITENSFEAGEFASSPLLLQQRDIDGTASLQRSNHLSVGEVEALLPVCAC